MLKRLLLTILVLILALNFWSCVGGGSGGGITPPPTPPPTPPTPTQGAFTDLFFLHHSVGNNLIVEGNVRETIDTYNTSHGTNFAFWAPGYNDDGLRDPQGNDTGTNYAIPILIDSANNYKNRR